MRRRSTGSGTVYLRADGRYEAAVYVAAPDGSRRRIRTYATTRRVAEQNLRQLLAREDAGVPTAVSRRVDDYLHEWLRTTAQIGCRPKTIELYSRVVEHYLIPRLGTYRLDNLGVRVVQAALDAAASDGVSVRMINEMRKVLRAALAQAEREELIVRNPARLVRVATYRPPEVIPWTPRQLATFLRAAENDRLYPAFVLLVLYGLRRGELVGLRWQDVDYELGVIRIRHQLQSVGGQLTIAPVKTRAGERDLPLLPLAEAMLQRVRTPHVNGYIFVTSRGDPIAPHSFGDAFKRIRDRTDLPPNRLHDLRHATATMLKSLGVPVRDAQRILGHASPLTTQSIYQHSTDAEQLSALQGVERLVIDLTAPSSRQRSRQTRSRLHLASGQQRSIGGPGGTRTLDTLLKSLQDLTVADRGTSVRELVNACQYRLMLGGAAVKISRQIAIVGSIAITDATWMAVKGTSIISKISETEYNRPAK